MYNISVKVCFTIIYHPNKPLSGSCNRSRTCCSMYSCCVCFRAFVDATMLKKRRQKVFDQLGGFSQQGAVCSILGKYIHKEVRSVWMRSWAVSDFYLEVLMQHFNYVYCLPLSEAFQRARKKMQDARESLPRDLIGSTSQLQSESST